MPPYTHPQAVALFEKIRTCGLNGEGVALQKKVCPWCWASETQVKTYKAQKVLKHTLIRVLKCFNLHSSPLTKGRGGRWLIGQGDVDLFGSSSRGNAKHESVAAVQSNLQSPNQSQSQHLNPELARIRQIDLIPQKCQEYLEYHQGFFDAFLSTKSQH